MKIRLNIFKKARPLEDSTRTAISILPYRYHETDLELSSTIKGLRKLGHVDQKPFGPYFYFKVDKETREDDINRFLDSLPKEFLLQFNKSLDDDSPAYTRMIVQSDGDKYLYHFFGQGQSKVWQRTNRKEVLSLILENREIQFAQSFRVYRCMKKGVVGFKG